VFRTRLVVALATSLVVVSAHPSGAEPQAGLAAVASAKEAAAALVRLQAGNDRFVKGVSQPAALDAARREVLAKGQEPFALILSCADSRVPPEHVFNVGLGDLFTIRTVGEVIDRSVLAGVEYGVEHLHIPLVVVMGHESCGAVKAAVDKHDKSLGPNLDYVVNAIRPATTRTKQERGEIKDAILANVEQVINDMLGKSEILRHAMESGSMQVVGAYYEFTGRVTFSEPVTGARATSHTTEHR
jgi:carbonic anhydrase